MTSDVWHYKILHPWGHLSSATGSLHDWHCAVALDQICHDTISCLHSAQQRKIPQLRRPHPSARRQRQNALRPSILCSRPPDGSIVSIGIPSILRAAVRNPVVGILATWSEVSSGRLHRRHRSTHSNPSALHPWLPDVVNRWHRRAQSPWETLPTLRTWFVRPVVSAQNVMRPRRAWRLRRWSVSCVGEISVSTAWCCRSPNTWCSRSPNDGRSAHQQLAIRSCVGTRKGSSPPKGIELACHSNKHLQPANICLAWSAAPETPTRNRTCLGHSTPDMSKSSTMWKMLDPGHMVVETSEDLCPVMQKVDYDSKRIKVTLTFKSVVSVSTAASVRRARRGWSAITSWWW